MKYRIIRINDISEIKTSKISVYDLNNRYIDSDGSLFGLRYNRIDKKIEIIKLVRKNTSDAFHVQKRIVREKFDNPSYNISDENIDSEEELHEAEEEQYIDPEAFINSTIGDMSNHKSRIQGIIMNLKTTEVFPRENKHEVAQLEDIFRNIEIDGILRFDELENYHKELTSYPRSITYYQAKLDTKSRQVIESLGNNKERVMRFIFITEMINLIFEIYNLLLNMMENLKELLDEKDIASYQNILQHDKQHFLDAQTSLSNTIEDINGIIRKTEPIKQYLLNPENI